LDKQTKQLWQTGLVLAVVVLLLYGQTLTHEFINFDDYAYITLNENVNSGIKWSNIKWAFTQYYKSNWHPVTWLSHMLDVELFALNPGGHHATNVLLHVLNTLLLLVFFHLTGFSIWVSAPMTALFAVHPTHTESVAWIAERKDVLSTFFFLLTLVMYIKYTERRTLLRYVLLCAFTILGLMAKPMLVTLPFVLLLLDFYPLKRLIGLETFVRLTWEKLPLFILCLGTAFVAYTAQQAGGAMLGGMELTLVARLENAIVAYSDYVVMAIIPSNLAIYYPHPGQWPLVDVLLASALLLSITVMVLGNLRTRPYLVFGWLWFLGTLVPVIGLVQIGGQYMANRYTYIPYIGLFIALVPLLWELFCKLENGRRFYQFALLVILIIYSAVTWQTTGYWKNTITLFTHSLIITDPDYQELIHHPDQFINTKRTLKPGHFTSYTRLGFAHAAQGDFALAVRHLDIASQHSRNNPNAHNNLGVVLAALDKKTAAIAAFERALDIDSNHESAKKNLEMFRAAWDMYEN